MNRLRLISVSAALMLLATAFAEGVTGAKRATVTAVDPGVVIDRVGVR